MLNKNCVICQKVCDSHCAGCWSVAYCGPEHQKQHWKEHKKTCQKPYTSKVEEKLGRFMIASRDIKAGEIILKEKPVVIGPATQDSPPMCLGCYKRLPDIGTEFQCSICRAPICSRECEKKPIHAEECEILKKTPNAMYSVYDHGSYTVHKNMDPMRANYQVILPIRGLLLKKNNLKKYKSMMNLQSHLEEREDGEAYTYTNNKIVPIIDLLNITWSHKDLVQEICGIYDTNCFELGTEQASICGIFPEASMMMHSCVKNTRVSFGIDFTMTLIARVAIKKGKPIFHSYVQSFTSTNIRRLMLFMGKHFGCECTRCRDPTDLGSYLSALKCKNCGGPVLAENPIDIETKWKCSKCNGNVINGPEVSALDRDLTLELKKAKAGDIEGLEHMIKLYGDRLHPHHAFMMNIKQQLSISYGACKGYEPEKLISDLIERKVALCQEVIDVLDILDPGISIERGIALYELFVATKFKIENNRKHGKNSSKDSKRDYLKAKDILQQVVDIFSFENATSKYYKHYEKSMKELQNLKIILGK